MLISNPLAFIILYTCSPVSQTSALASVCLRNLVGYWGSLEVPRLNSYALEVLSQFLWVSVPIPQHPTSLDTVLQCLPEFPNGLRSSFPWLTMHPLLNVFPPCLISPTLIISWYPLPNNLALESLSQDLGSDTGGTKAETQLTYWMCWNFVHQLIYIFLLQIKLF